MIHEGAAKSVADRKPSWRKALSVACIWIPAGLLGLYLKHAIVLKNGLVIARFLGRGFARDLEATERLSLFGFDLLLWMVAAPLIAAVLVRYVRPRRLVPWCIFVVATLFSLLCFANLQTLGNVGRFLSLGMLRDAIRFSYSHPDQVEAYVDASSLLKLGLAIGAVLGASGAAMISGAPNRLGAALDRWMPRFLGATVLVAALLCVVAWSSSLPRVPQHRSAAAAAIVAFFEIGSSGAGEFEDMPVRELRQFYRDFARVPPSANAAYDESEKGSDLILFIMETGPMRCLLPQDLTQFPVARDLSRRAFIGARHYSTYPYTSDAVYSMFTSRYPPEKLRQAIRFDPAGFHCGLFASLRAEGYTTRTYSPYAAEFEEDERMYELLGVERQFVVEELSTLSARAKALMKRDLGGIATEDRGKAEGRLHRDMMCLDKMMAEIAELKQSKRRFVAAILPQIGHGPWFKLDGHGDMLARGRAAMKYQDRWLGAVVEQLRENGWSDDTIIVVTADHGVRTKTEDPTFRAGMISDYSFHVPLMIHAPRALQDTVNIPYVTSHIDIAPTLLTLLGATRHREFEQGSPIWNVGLQDRKTFVFANGYLGADGYHDRGQYFMFGRLSELTYQNDRLQFPPSTMLAGEAAKAVAASATIDIMTRLQRRWCALPGENPGDGE